VRAKDLFNTGLRAFNSGNYAQAEKYFERAIPYDPTNFDFREGYAAALQAQYIAKGRSSENALMGKKALQAYIQAVYCPADTKKIDKVHAIIANLYKEQGDYQQYRAWLIKRLDLPGQSDKTRADLHYTLAVCFWEESYKISQKYVMPRSQPPKYQPPQEWQPRDLELVKNYANTGLQDIEATIKIDPKYDYCAYWSYRDLLRRELAKVATDPKIKQELSYEGCKDVC
jgi:tetratricopeptide (TPR) repeat protein